MCGTVQIILPSEFSGGELEISHDCWSTKQWNMAPRSSESTFIVATHNDVTHTLGPVTSGYRLSLVYKLIARSTPGTSLCPPVLPDSFGVRQTLLCDILKSWKLDLSPTAPQVLGCMLHHQYHTVSDFNAGSLRGPDELLLSHLRPLARELGFYVYLARITREVTGTVQEPTEEKEEWYSWNRCRTVTEILPYDLDELSMEPRDVRSESLATDLFDLDGMPLSVNDFELPLANIVGVNILRGGRDIRREIGAHEVSGRHISMLPVYTRHQVAHDRVRTVVF